MRKGRARPNYWRGEGDLGAIFGVRGNLWIGRILGEYQVGYWKEWNVSQENTLKLLASEPKGRRK